MPKGLGDIPELRLEVLQNFITKWLTPPELVLMNLFSSSISPSSVIPWESQTGSRGMAPFKPPGAPTPITFPHGVAQHSAEAAFWGEKMYFDEEFLNNLRKEGTTAEYLDSSARLSREYAGLINRTMRRKEWMFAQMMFSGGFTYDTTKGVKLDIDYDIATANQVTLSADYKWSDGTSKDIIGDIITGKRVVSNACGGLIDYGVCNSTVLQYLAQDQTIQTLLQKSTFGNGNLYDGNVNKIVGVNPKIIGGLLDIPNILVYDEVYEVRAMLTAVVTGASTVTVSVDNVADFVAGGTLRFHDVSLGTYEDETIASVQVEASTVTVSTAPTASFKAGEDYVGMTKKFVPDDKFVMFSSRVDGKQIAEYKQAPFGLDRHYGMKTDRKDEWDPDGIFIRVQDKGLPVLYQRDALYLLDVA